MNSGTEVTLTGIWGTSYSDVFAVGEEGTILHYDGEKWDIMASDTTNKLLNIWGTQPSCIKNLPSPQSPDIWAGLTKKTLSGSSMAFFLLRSFLR